MTRLWNFIQCISKVCLHKFKKCFRFFGSIVTTDFSHTTIWRLRLILRQNERHTLECKSGKFFYSNFPNISWNIAKYENSWILRSDIHTQVVTDYIQVVEDNYFLDQSTPTFITDQGVFFFVFCYASRLITIHHLCVYEASAHISSSLHILPCKWRCRKWTEECQTSQLSWLANPSLVNTCMLLVTLRCR